MVPGHPLPEKFQLNHSLNSTNKTICLITAMSKLTTFFITKKTKGHFSQKTLLLWLGYSVILSVDPQSNSNEM